ncbi:MAG: FkbM family methyltransferase, partial [Deltaproteobacteria bacterium]|nr:FkbM family methyltransferase [Deltaproteobacteria bacterium]
ISLNDGDCVIDIGANIGLFTLFVQQQCKNTSVYAFEPSPPAFKVLDINTSLYGSDVKVFNCGLSDEAKEASFTFYEKSSVFSSFNADVEQDEKAIRAVVQNMLKQNGPTDPGDLDKFVDELMAGRLESKSFVCQLISLSDVIRDNNIQQIDLLKIDAEKSELDILKGIEAGDWSKIKQIVIE